MLLNRDRWIRMKRINTQLLRLDSRTLSRPCTIAGNQCDRRAINRNTLCRQFNQGLCIMSSTKTTSTLPLRLNEERSNPKNAHILYILCSAFQVPSAQCLLTANQSGWVHSCQYRASLWCVQRKRSLFLFFNQGAPIPQFLAPNITGR